jgi:hypothetical protein
MRAIEYLRTIIIATFIAITFTSCGNTAENNTPITPDDNTGTTSKEPPTYTIIYYASGGGAEDAAAGRGLDFAIEKSIEYFLDKRKLEKNVKFTACIKWSKGYEGKYVNGDGQTYRFFIDKEHDGHDFELVGDNSYAINDPNNIAEFISWSKEVAPSDEYIVVFSGHGNGWHPEVGVNDTIESTRGIMRDTDTGRYISCEELNEGLEIADTHFRMIFLGSCLMNTIEYVTALSQYADYILASSHISIMFTTELNLLAHMLERDIKDNSDQTFVSGINDYLNNGINTTISNTDHVYDRIDFTLTDCKKVDGILEATKNFTDTIIALYDEEESIGQEAFKQKYGATIADMELSMAESYYFLGQFMSDQDIYESEYIRQSFTYDLGDIALKASEALDNDKLKSAYEALHKASQDAQSVCYTTTMVSKKKLHHSVVLTNAEKWEERNYDDSGYEELLFDKRTGWSRLLKRNNIPLKF